MVKAGYKQTEIGVIPEDWKVQPLSSICESMQNGVFFKPSKKGQGIRLINVSDLYTSIPIDVKNLELFDASDDERKRFSVLDGDLFFTRSSVVPSGIAHCNIYKNDDDESVVFDSHVIRVRPKSDEIFPYFFYRYCVSQSARKYLVAHAKTATMTTIDQGVMGKLPVAIPSYKEQEAIAEALADVDGLIAGLDRLIAKKRDVKTGTMQQLLTGKKRLPGFENGRGYKQTEIGRIPKDWDVKPLITVSTLNGRIGWQGLKQSEFNSNPDDPFLITGMNFKDGEIRWDEVYHIPETRYKIAPNIQLRTGDVLMTKDGTIGKLLYVDNIPYPGKASLNSHLLLFRPINGQYVPKFLFYQLGFKPFLDHIELNKSGSTFFGITQEAIGKYQAFLPTIPEQHAIAEVLSDIDTEITALEARRAKTQAIKQGMMQELLTGRTRLL